MESPSKLATPIAIRMRILVPMLKGGGAVGGSGGGGEGGGGEGGGGNGGGGEGAKSVGKLIDTPVTLSTLTPKASDRSAFVVLRR